MYRDNENQQIHMDNQGQGEQVAQHAQPASGPIYAPGYAAPVSQGQRSQVTPVNASEAMNITNITDLQTYAKGVVVRFPDFATGQPLVARVRRPSMLALARFGKIPNSLLQAASDLFQKGAAINTKSDNLLGDMYDVVKVVCSAALIEPTFSTFDEVGMPLSDQQLMSIFNYTQVGVEALDSFRTE